MAVDGSSRHARGEAEARRGAHKKVFADDPILVGGTLKERLRTCIKNCVLPSGLRNSESEEKLALWSNYGCHSILVGGRRMATVFLGMIIARGRVSAPTPKHRASAVWATIWLIQKHLTTNAVPEQRQSLRLTADLCFIVGLLIHTYPERHARLSRRGLVDETLVRMARIAPHHFRPEECQRNHAAWSCQIAALVAARRVSCVQRCAERSACSLVGRVSSWRSSADVQAAWTFEAEESDRGLVSRKALESCGGPPPRGGKGRGRLTP